VYMSLYKLSRICITNNIRLYLHLICFVTYQPSYQRKYIK